MAPLFSPTPRVLYVGLGCELGRGGSAPKAADPRSQRGDLIRFLARIPQLRHTRPLRYVGCPGFRFSAWNAFPCSRTSAPPPGRNCDEPETSTTITPSSFDDSATHEAEHGRARIAGASERDHHRPADIRDRAARRQRSRRRVHACPDGDRLWIQQHQFQRHRRHGQRRDDRHRRCLQRPEHPVRSEHVRYRVRPARHDRQRGQ